MKRIFVLMSFLFTAAQSGPTVAEDATPSCLLCSPKIILDQRRALCFIEQYADSLKKLETENSFFVKIDLESCKSASRGGGVFSSGKTPSFDREMLGRIVFLDRPGIECVQKFIGDAASMSAVKTVVLEDIC